MTQRDEKLLGVSNEPNVVDTETAAREELAQACVTLHR
jgi:hypothetical protein